jgi:very-short-patch-repair endonuclease
MNQEKGNRTWLINRLGQRIHLSKRQQNMERVGKTPFERRRAFRKSPTPAEKRFREILKSNFIEHSFQRVVFTATRFYILDFVVRIKPLTIIEIDGSVHEGREWEDRQREIDVLKTKTYGGKKKFVFLRIKNEQVFNGEAENIIRSRWAHHIKNAEKRRHETI